MKNIVKKITEPVSLQNNENNQYCLDYFNKDLQATITEIYTNLDRFVMRLVDIQSNTRCEISSVSTFSRNSSSWR